MFDFRSPPKKKELSPKRTSEHVWKIRRSDLSSCTTIYCLRYLSRDTVCPPVKCCFTKRDGISSVREYTFAVGTRKSCFVTLYTYTYEHAQKKKKKKKTETGYTHRYRYTQTKIHYTLFRVLFVLIMKF